MQIEGGNKMGRNSFNDEHSNVFYPKY